MTKNTAQNAIAGMPVSTRHAIGLTATAILGAVIAYLTLSPPLMTNPPGILSDKAYHAIAFAALIFPCALLYARSLIWVVPAALLFGGAIELIQPYVGRAAELADFVADAVGVGFGVVAGLILRRRLIKPRQ